MHSGRGIPCSIFWPYSTIQYFCDWEIPLLFVAYLWEDVSSWFMPSSLQQRKPCNMSFWGKIEIIFLYRYEPIADFEFFFLLFFLFFSCKTEKVLRTILHPELIFALNLYLLMPMLHPRTQTVNRDVLCFADTDPGALCSNIDWESMISLIAEATGSNNPCSLQENFLCTCY